MTANRPLHSGSWDTAMQSVYWRPLPLTGNTLRELDTCGLDCPLPLLKAKQQLNAMASGEILRVHATDPGSQRDFRVFAEQSGHALLESSERDGVFIYILRKR
jgi:TusA-related sulfurtransferase